MATPSPTWNTVPVFGTWRSIDGTPKAGQIRFTIAERIVATTDDVIFPGPSTLTVSLDTAGAVRVDFPACDDPDVTPVGWSVKVEEKLSDGSGKIYYIQPTLSMLPTGLNLRTVVVPDSAPSAPAPALLKGVAGGLAALDADGDVVDAAGEKVIASGGAATTDASALTTGTLDVARVADASLTKAKLATAVQTSLGKADSAAQPADVSAAVAALVNAAPSTLDTLGEIAAALASDESAAATLTTTVGTKLAKASNLSDLTSTATARTNLGLGTAATQASTAFATAAQGTKADTAVQPAALTSGLAGKENVWTTYATKTAALAAVSAGTLPDGGKCIVLDPTT